MGSTLLRLAISALVISTIAAAPPPAFAQQTITVSGIVRDVSGGLITQAAVDIVVAGRVTTSVTTGADGRYQLQAPTGTPFALRARRDGFTDQLVELSGTTADLSRDLTMPIGTMSDTLVVTAARGAESRATVTQSVSVATRSDLEALGSTELSEVLRFVPGASVEGTGREGGGPTSLFVRGGDSDYNVVLIDGVRVNLDGGRFDFSRVAAGEIERVEVVRGAQSSLWGADAMTSVVQIITKRAQPGDPMQATVSFEAGSFETVRGNAGVFGGYGTRVDYRAGVTVRRTQGAFEDILPEADRYRQTAFDAGVGVSLSPRAFVRGGLRFSDGEGRNVGPISYGARDTGGLYETRDLSLYSTIAHTLGSRFAGTATLNYFRYRGLSADRIADPAFGTYAILSGTPNAIFPNGTRLVRLLDRPEFDALVAAGALPAPGQFLASQQTTDFPFNPEGCETQTPSCLTRFRRPSVRYQGDYQWSANQRLSVGYDWEREKNLSVAGFNLDNHGFFVQQQTSLADRWFVTLGARVDRKESYGTFVSPKLSAGGFLVPFRPGALSSLKVFGNFGRGVKTATFAERFGGSFADPNPDVDVERVRSADAGVEVTLAEQRVRATATYFRNDFTDQISFRPGTVGDGIPEYINIDGSKARGVELDVALQRPLYGFTAMGTYALVDSEVVTNQSTSQQFQPGQPLLRRPKHSGSIRAAYARGRATVNFNLRLIGQRFDNSFLSLRTVPNAERPAAMTTDITVNPGYAVASLGLDVRATGGVTLYVRGDNIGDTTYDTALGYRGLPRAVVVGARVLVGSVR